MAIKTQHPYIDETGAEKDTLIKTYSDLGLRILQVETGEIYDEAIDVYPSKYTYSETKEYIEGYTPTEDENEIDYETAYNNIAAEVLSNG